MRKITAAIIDDELAAAENIEILLNKYCPEVEVVGMAHSISNGIQLIKQKEPKLIFLDIYMPPEGSGFDLLEIFPKRNFHVIFVTAHEQFSLKAIKQHAFDYLLKPIDYKELIITVEQFKDLHHSPKEENISVNTPRSVTLSTDQGVHVIHCTDILFCKASGSYTEFHIVGRSPILISKPLKFALGLLSNKVFKRVHRSYIVNSSKITRFTKEDGGYVYIGKEGIPVSKKYFGNLYDLLD